jgi:hypothetical protein
MKMPVILLARIFYSSKCDERTCGVVYFELLPQDQGYNDQREGSKNSSVAHVEFAETAQEINVQ